MLQLEEFISVIEKKEEENFGKTVQVVPHINEIKDRMQLLGNLAIMIL
jgi:CTP synthase (UTP-ammonia lyase)